MHEVSVTIYQVLTYCTCGESKLCEKSLKFQNIVTKIVAKFNIILSFLNKTKQALKPNKTS